MRSVERLDASVAIPKHFWFVSNNAFFSKACQRRSVKMIIGKKHLMNNGLSVMPSLLSELLMKILGRPCPLPQQRMFHRTP